MEPALAAAIAREDQVSQYTLHRRRNKAPRAPVCIGLAGSQQGHVAVLILANGEVPGWIDADTGVGAGTGCIDLIEIDKIYLIPVFLCISEDNTGIPTTSADCTQSSGTNTWYYITRFVAFQVTGLRLTSTGGWDGHPSPATQTECNKISKDKKCLAGFFVEDYDAGDGEIDTDGDWVPSGPTVYRAIG